MFYFLFVKNVLAQILLGMEFVAPSSTLFNFQMLFFLRNYRTTFFGFTQGVNDLFLRTMTLLHVPCLHCSAEKVDYADNSDHC